jgi:hypothetical protein
MGKPLKFFFLVHSRFPRHCTDKAHYPLTHPKVHYY